MIQRIQSLYMLLTAAISACYFIFPFSLKIFPAASQTSQDVIYKLTSLGIMKSEEGAFTNIQSYWYLTALCSITILIPLIALFIYYKRPLQIKLCRLTMLVCLSIIVVDYFVSDRMAADIVPGKNPVYMYASYVPLLQFVFLYLAANAIRKDEELVRSADRIR